MADPVTRETLLVQALPSKVVSSVEVRRITLLPDVEGGAHVHNGPVFGSIELGSVLFAVGSEAPRTLIAGDVFYEPAHDTITRWTATEQGVTFLGYFLLSDGETPELRPAAKSEVCFPTPGSRSPGASSQHKWSAAVEEQTIRRGLETGGRGRSTS